MLDHNTFPKKLYCIARVSSSKYFFFYGNNRKRTKVGIFGKRHPVKILSPIRLVIEVGTLLFSEAYLGRRAILLSKNFISLKKTLSL